MTVAVAAVVKRWLTQAEAAVHLGVSVRWFRDNVHVQPKPVGMPRPGVRPVLRYDVYELDAWVEKCDQAFLEVGRAEQ